MCPRRGRHLWYSETFTSPQGKLLVDWCCACGERSPVSDISEWNFSAHAVDRALDMALDAEEVRLALTRPHMMRNAPLTRPEYEGCRIFIRDRISVVVNPETKTVITFIWHEQYKSGDTRRRTDAREDEEFFRDK